MMKRSTVRFALIPFSVLVAVCGQLAAKSGATLAMTGRVVNAFLIVSLICLFARGAAWAVVLRHERLVFAYPFMAATYPLLLVLAWLVFGEAVTPAKAVGATLVLAGVAVVVAAERHR